MALIEIKTILGDTIFSYEAEDNTYNETVKKAAEAGVDFSYVDFYDKELSGVDFRGLNMFSANFRRARVTDCIFRETNLNGSNFDNATLSNCEFYSANFKMASMFRTMIDGCTFAFADFSNADLLESTFKKSYLCGAGFGGTRNVPMFIPTYLPVESFIGWVKVIGEDKDYIVKIKILKESQRSRGVGDVCRCDKAVTLDIQDVEGNSLDIDELEYIDKSGTLLFKRWEVTECENWNPGRWIECQNGITFFIDRESAVLYE